MSHEQYDKTHVFNCDHPGCNKNVQGDEEESFHDVWYAAKAKGWRTMKIGIDWVHFCPIHAVIVGG